MKRMVRGALISALALAVGVGVGLPASAATTPTLTLSGGSGVFGFDASIAIKAVASVPGTVKYVADGTVIAGCEAVATTAAEPYVATCAWIPKKPAPVVILTGTLTPKDAVTYTSADAPAIKGSVGVSIQTTSDGPIQIYVDTVLATGSTGAIAPRFNGCAIMNEFLLGQKILFRAYANNADQGSAVMDPSNTKEAYVEIAGVKDRLPMVYRNHSGVSFWTTTLQTGTAPGQYSTLGRINFKVVFTAKDSNTMKVLSTKLVARVENGQRVKDAYGSTIYDRVSYYRTVTVTPALKGATGVFNPEWASASMLTLFAVPTK